MNKIILTDKDAKDHRWLIDKIGQQLTLAAEYAAFHDQWEDEYMEHVKIMEKAILHARIILRHIEEKKAFNATLSNEDL